MSFSLINRRFLLNIIPQLLISYQVVLQVDEFFQEGQKSKSSKQHRGFHCCEFRCSICQCFAFLEFPACCFFKKSKHFCTSASILFRSVKISIQQSGHCDFLLNVDSTKCVPNAFSTTGAHALPIISVVNQRTEKVDVLKDENLSKNQH